MFKSADNCQIKHFDDICDKYFHDKKNGYFVDVGAYDGYTFSNTYGLAMAGWQGLLIEPLPDSMKQCKWLYGSNPKIKFLQACIASRFGETELFVQGAGSTISKNTTEKHPTFKDHITVPMYTLDMALARNGIPKRFEVLSIDVEGAEMEVLAGFSWKLWKPKMVIIELLVDTLDLVGDAILDWFKSTDYKIIHNDKLNAIYWLED